MIHDQPLCDLSREIDTEVSLHERQREVDARRHPRRGPHRTIVRENAVFFDAHFRISGLQLAGIQPMRCGPPAIENSSLGQHERTRTNGRHAPRLCGFAPQKREDAFAGWGDPRRTGDQQGVVRARKSRSVDSDADRAAHDTAALRDDTDLVERFAGKDVGDIECRHGGRAHDLTIASDHEAYTMHDRTIPHRKARGTRWPDSRLFRP